MLLTSPKQRLDECRECREGEPVRTVSDGSRSRSPPRFCRWALRHSGSVLAQHGKSVFGESEHTAAATVLYAPPEYQPGQYQSPYQQQQTNQYLQYEEASRCGKQARRMSRSGKLMPGLCGLGTGWGLCGKDGEDCRHLRS